MKHASGVRIEDPVSFPGEENWVEPEAEHEDDDDHFLDRVLALVDPAVAGTRHVAVQGGVDIVGLQSAQHSGTAQ